jgi:hypothetical protein
MLIKIDKSNKNINAILLLLIYICTMDNHKVFARLDHIGITASTICAIHCAVVPIIFTSLPLIGLGFLALPWVEWGMIVLALLIGVYSIGLSYRRSHRKILPLILLIAGFTIIMLGHLFLTGRLEGLIVPIGGMVIALAHFVNYRYVGACDHAIGEH